MCIDNAALVVKFNKQILVYKGQREGETKWKGWSWKLLLVKLFILFILFNLFINIILFKFNYLSTQ